MSDTNIRVIIADDESLIATSLATLLGLEEDIQVMNTFASGEELLEWWCKREILGDELPHAAVLDLNMAGMDGIETAQALLGSDSTVATMIVTSHARPRGLKKALEAGVKGFLPKSATAEQFASGIRTIIQGRRYLDPDVAALAIALGESPLSERETEVLEQVGSAGSIDDIAATVHLAPGTVRNYLSSAMNKLGSVNRFEAYQQARDSGWV